MTHYQILKEYIINKLRKDYSNSMTADDIKQEMEKLKKHLNDNPAIFSEILDLPGVLRYLSKDEWDIMHKEVEVIFDVSMGSGVFITGEEHRNRKDRTWWSQMQKQEDNYYWSRYKKELQEYLSFNVLKVTDDVTDKIMDNIGYPSLDNFDIRGMVVGHVQSGKTSNYTGLICKAADAGYKVIVVIAGAMDNLRNQTQQRLNHSFVGIDRGDMVGVGVGDESKVAIKSPISLTTVVRDFNKSDADNNMQTIRIGSFSAPILLVIKKNSSILRNLIDWLGSQDKESIKNEAILVIDDESDYASINTKKEDDPTMINKRIRELLEIFPKRSYVAYTATPFANIFIDHEASHKDQGEDLFPRDFIVALDAPDNYMGARKIFYRGDDEGDEYNDCLVPIEDYI
ncbi:MAG: endonuclease, partial [Endozoicomonadaceae bacterium]|nr:endonuclease [Endozoicomonadaceae bacterium]